MGFVTDVTVSYMYNTLFLFFSVSGLLKTWVPFILLVCVIVVIYILL